MWSNIMQAAGESQDDGWDEDDFEDDEEEEEEVAPKPGGLFMGRLTKFLDKVTAPQEYDDDDEYTNELGWEEGDTSLGLDETNNSASLMPQHQSEDAPPPSSEANGWGNTNDDDFEMNDQNNTNVNDIIDGWGDDEDEDYDGLEVDSPTKADFDQAQAQIDGVMSSVHRREDAVRHVSEQDGLADDERHSQQAVAAIQKDLQVVENLPQLQSNNNSADPQGGDGESIRVTNSEEFDDVDDHESRFGLVVNHTPTVVERPIPLEREASMAVQMNDGWDDEADLSIDDDEEDQEWTDNLKDPAPEPPAVVDQTPSVAAPLTADPSVAALASEFDDNDDEMDEKRGEFGPVVDHTPSGAPPPLEAVNSLAVFASEVEDDFRKDDEMDETVSFGNGEGDGWAQDENDDLDFDDDDDSGVDHVEIPLPGSLQGSRKNVMVDHTPSEVVPDTNDSNLSTVVLATDEDMTRGTENDNDDQQLNDANEDAFGLVVDHTPQPSQPVVSGANSLAVNYQKEQDEDDDEFGDSIVEDITVCVGNFNDDEGDPNMVDHTPAEMEGSPTKASGTSVAVLASVLDTTSNFGDYSATDQSYGPVVDQTPQTPMPATRSDSVIVQAQDLDTVDSVEESEEEEDDDEIDDEMPAALPSNEDKLVDHVPQRPESRFGDASTLAAAEASELMSEVDDMAQEQNFGPVVDLTPTLRATNSTELPSGAGSTAVFASQSVAEDDLEVADETQIDENGWDDTNVEETPNPQSGNDEPEEQPEEQQLVDFLPVRDNSDETDRASSLNADEDSSEVAVGGANSLALQPEDPKEDDFGPVVDVTPIASSPQASGFSIASVATQLTASECRAMEKDDTAEREDEDTENEESKVVVDTLPSQIRAKRYVDSIATIGQSQLTADEEEDNESDGYGPVVDHLPNSRASLAPSRGGSTVDALATVSEVDSDDEDGGGWDDDGDLDLSVGGVSERAQQPVPTKTASRQSLSTVEDRNVSVRFDASVDENSRDSLPRQADLWNGKTDLPFDKQLAEADTPPSTPYRRSHEANDRVAGSVEGVCLPMSLMQAGSNNPVSDEEMRQTIQSLQQAMSDLEIEKMEAMKKVEEVEANSAVIEDQRNEWLQKEIALKAEVEHLRATEKGSVDISGFDALTRELSAKVDVCGTLEAEIASLRKSLEEMRSKDADLSDRLELEVNRANTAEQKFEDLQDELQKRFKVETDALEVARNQMQADLTESHGRMNDELKSKSITIEKQEAEIQLLQVTVGKLESQIQSAGNELSHQRSLARESEMLADELLAVAKERDVLQEALVQSKEAIASLQTLVDECDSRMGVANSSMDSEIGALSNELAGTKASLSRTEQLLQESNDRTSALAEERDKLVHRLNVTSAELNSERSRAEHLEQTAAQLDGDLQERSRQIESLLQERNELDQTCNELKTVHEELVSDAKSLEGRISELVEQQAGASHEIQELNAQLTSSHEVNKGLMAEKEEIEANFGSLTTTLRAVEQELAITKLDYTQKIEEQSAAHAEIVDQLRVQLTEAEKSIEVERRTTGERIVSLEHDLVDARKNSVDQERELKDEIDRLNTNLSSASDQVKVVEDSLAEVSRERDAILAENEEVLVQLGLFHQAIQEKEAEVRSLEDKLSATESALADTGLEQSVPLTQYRAAQDSVVALESRLDELQAELETHNQNRLQNHESLDDAKSTIQNLTELLEDKQSNLEVALQSEMEKAAQIESLGARLQQAQEDIDSARKQAVLDCQPASPSQETEKGDDAVLRTRHLEEQVKILKTELQGKSHDIHSKESYIASLEREVERATSELDELRLKEADHEQLVSSQVNSDELELLRREIDEKSLEVREREEEIRVLSAKLSTAAHASNGSNGGSIDTLKSHVVTLAIALERSENMRAESIDKLLHEREANAESLRRLSESVKRFYSAIRSGENHL